MTQKYYSHGKLLLTGEYVVLDGALSLALPTKKGQLLEVTKTAGSRLHWQSFLQDKKLWIDTSFDLPLKKNFSNDNDILHRLEEVFFEVYKKSPSSFKEGVTFKSFLEFDRSWGLGSSSTLIANIAQWAAIDPYELLENTFGGSGYDIACASAKGPITFSLEEKRQKVQEVHFNPPFKEEVFFVHLNKKQNSRESIKHYRATHKIDLKPAIHTISQITAAFIKTQQTSDFEKLIYTHENLISSIIKTPTIKEQFFSDYPRAIKSLGGWGGDFILVMGTHKDMVYFKDKGYHTIIPYEKMIL